MKKLLYIQFTNIRPNHGISNKILSQKSAFVTNGLETILTSISGNCRTGWKFFIDDQIIGQKSSMNINIYKLFYSYPCFSQYAKENKIKNIYWRWNGFTIGTLILALRLYFQGCRIYMEIPTYPYEDEWDYSKQDWIANLPHRCDQVIRHFWRFFIHRIVTFSNDKMIYGVPCINISNGYVPERIKVKKITPYEGCVHMVAVAMVQWWHGFDRIIDGLNEYYKGRPSVPVTLTIIGDGEIAPLQSKVVEYGLQKYVNFTGAISGPALDDQFDIAHVAIGSLGRHRSGLTTMKSLKNVEYASRGIPFVYSENNPDFEGKPFVMKAPADESPLDVNAVVEFSKNMTLTPEEIHTYARPYTWVEQLRPVSKDFLL